MLGIGADSLSHVRSFGLIPVDQTPGPDSPRRCSPGEALTDREKGALDVLSSAMRGGLVLPPDAPPTANMDDGTHLDYLLDAEEKHVHKRTDTRQRLPHAEVRRIVDRLRPCAVGRRPRVVRRRTAERAPIAGIAASDRAP